MQRGLSLEAVAKVTKIQPRILERLEAGKLEGLPAEVFVRGFVRSFARCVGLDEDEALRRYAACGLAAGTADLTPTVRALVEAMVDLAPGAAGSSAPRATPRRMTAVQPVEIIELGAPGMPATTTSSPESTGAVVETMMLPETGTVVMPAQLFATPREPVEPPSAMPAGSFDAMPAVEPEPVVTEPVAASEPVEPVATSAAVEPVAVEPVAVEPVVASAAVAPVVAGAAVAASEPAKKKRGRRGGKGRNKRDAARDALATGTPPAASPVVTDVAVSAEISAAADAEQISDAASPPTAIAPTAPSAIDWSAAPVSEPTETWAPKMPPAAPSVPWRRPAYVAPPAVIVPSLVIDDADPDSAERVLEERAEAVAPRRSFLPPILLDREDRSARQGGLTLAVIILLIAATLTLSYLMRRPSASGDGMTRLETPASYVG